MQIVVRKSDGLILMTGEKLPGDIAGTTLIDLDATPDAKAIFVAMQDANGGIHYTGAGSVHVTPAPEPDPEPVTYDEEELTALISGIKTVEDATAVLLLLVPLLQGRIVKGGGTV